MLSTSNNKILDFYKLNPHINFETVNLLFVDLFEKIINDKNGEINSVINNQILSIVQDVKGELHSLNSTNINMVNNLTLKMHEMKESYLQSMTSILQGSNSENIDKVNGLIDQQNKILMDKTSILLNEIVPKSNEQFHKQISNDIQHFHESLNKDTNKLIHNLENENSIHNFSKIVEQKTNQILSQIQQPIFSFINSSEERLCNNLNEIKNKNISQEETMKDLSKFLGKYKNSSYKGQLGETQLENVLNQMYPSGQILNTTGISESCDFRIERLDLPTILVETKKYDRNVPIDEVKKFIRDITIQKNHGIFLSQNSGITSKQNYQIDIRENNILIYVHEVDYNPTKIKIAFDIIDSLDSKLKNLSNENDNGFKINEEIIKDINEEYQKFLNSKLAIIDLMKDFQKKLTKELDFMNFPELGKYLGEKFGTNLQDKNETILCNICNNYNAKTNKALATHQRHCKKKKQEININI